MTKTPTQTTVAHKGFVILGLSVLFNGSAVHLMRVALQSATPAIASSISASSAAVTFVVAGWIWRCVGWRWADWVTAWWALPEADH